MTRTTTSTMTTTTATPANAPPINIPRELLSLPATKERPDYVCVCVCVCLPLPSNQSFYRLIAGYWMGGGGERESMANKLVT